MQIIGLYFTNSLEKELTRNFKTNIEQHVKQINYNIKKTYNSEDPNRNFQKEIQNILDDYANRTEIDEIKFIDQDQIIVATSKSTNQNTVNQKVNDSSVQKALSLGKANDKIVLKMIHPIVIEYGSKINLLNTKVKLSEIYMLNQILILFTNS